MEWPLALCDARTVQPTDLISSDFIRRKYTGETYFTQYNANQKWYYLSGQENDEVAVLKIYDSSHDVEAKCTKTRSLAFFRLIRQFARILRSESTTMDL